MIMVGWEDVEKCVNNPMHYMTEIIHPNSGEKIQFDDKKSSIDAINQGCTFIISGYSFYNSEVNELAKQIEDALNLRCDMHLYGGTKKNIHNSFGIHKDTSANFICQIDGVTNWKVYDDDKNIILDTNLTRGDILYIPFDKFHCAEPFGKRLSMSIALWNHPKIDRNYYKLEENKWK